jgi:hypothetical protein
VSSTLLKQRPFSLAVVRVQVEILRKQLLVAVVVVVGSLGKGLDIIFGILVMFAHTPHHCLFSRPPQDKRHIEERQDTLFFGLASLSAKM